MVLNVALPGSIAIFYNLFTHHFISMMYKNYPYDQKQRRTIITLFMIGMVGIVLSKTVFSDNDKLKNELLQKGAFYGGVLLVLTSLLSGWNDMGDQMKLGFIGIVFGILIYFSYKAKQENDIKEEVDELLEELANESEDEEVVAAAAAATDNKKKKRKKQRVINNNSAGNGMPIVTTQKAPAKKVE